MVVARIAACSVGCAFRTLSTDRESRLVIPFVRRVFDKYDQGRSVSGIRQGGAHRAPRGLLIRALLLVTSVACTNGVTPTAVSSPDPSQIIGTWSVMATTTRESGALSAQPTNVLTFVFSSTCLSPNCPIQLTPDSGASPMDISYAGGSYKAASRQILQCPGSPQIGLAFDDTYEMTPTAGRTVAGHYEATKFSGKWLSEVHVANGLPTANCASGELERSLQATRIA